MREGYHWRPDDRYDFGPAASNTLTEHYPIFGVVVGGFVFLFGVMIAAIGQLLLAQADTAIHTSPFLTKEEKARAMSLTYRT